MSLFTNFFFLTDLGVNFICFPSSRLMIIGVPFFLIFGGNKGTQQEKEEEGLLGNLDSIRLKAF